MRCVLVGLLVLCLAVVAIGIPRLACRSESADIGEPGPLPVRGRADGGTPEARAVARGLSTFGFDLLSRQAEATAGNVTLSPASIASVLSMIRNGAQDKTEAELATALGVDGLDPILVNQGWADLITAAQTGKKTSVAIWNSLWLYDGLPFEPAFLAVNREYYAADCLPLNKDFATAVEEINRWASERTSGKLPKLFQVLEPLTRLVVVNTINLKVGWELFDEKDTKLEPFHTAAGADVDVDMMHGSVRSDGDGDEKTAVVGREDFTAVRLRTDGPVDVWVVVPTGENTPEDVVRTLADGGGVSDLYAEAQGWWVEVALPRFEIIYQYPDDRLKADLQAMGITRLFDEDTAQLGGIANVPPLYVSRIAHTARIKVDEHGVEAQAASGAQVGCTGMPVEIKADRPFLVVLAEAESQAPLFLTIVRDPRATED